MHSFGKREQVMHRANVARLVRLLGVGPASRIGAIAISADLPDQITEQFRFTCEYYEGHCDFSQTLDEDQRELSRKGLRPSVYQMQGPYLPPETSAARCRGEPWGPFFYWPSTREAGTVVCTRLC